MSFVKKVYAFSTLSILSLGFIGCKTIQSKEAVRIKSTPTPVARSIAPKAESVKDKQVHSMNRIFPLYNSYLLIFDLERTTPSRNSSRPVNSLPPNPNWNDFPTGSGNRLLPFKPPIVPPKTPSKPPSPTPKR